MSIGCVNIPSDIYNINSGAPYQHNQQQLELIFHIMSQYWIAALYEKTKLAIVTWSKRRLVTQVLKRVDASTHSCLTPKLSGCKIDVILYTWQDRPSLNIGLDIIPIVSKKDSAVWQIHRTSRDNHSNAFYTSRHKLVPFGIERYVSEYVEEIAQVPPATLSPVLVSHLSTQP